jgi:hypothetical protein
MPASSPWANTGQRLSMMKYIIESMVYIFG